MHADDSLDSVEPRLDEGGFIALEGHGWKLDGIEEVQALEMVVKLLVGRINTVDVDADVEYCARHNSRGWKLHRVRSCSTKHWSGWRTPSHRCVA